MEISRKIQKYIAIACALVLVITLAAVAYNQNQSTSADLAANAQEDRDTKKSKEDDSVDSIDTSAGVDVVDSDIQEDIQAEDSEDLSGNFIERDADQIDEVEEESSGPAVPKEVTTEAPESEVSRSFSYVAGVGDSYSLFARQSIDSYLEDEKISLDDNQRLNAEVWLANNAGSPMLEINQQVEVGVDQVESAVNSTLLVVGAEADNQDPVVLSENNEVGSNDSKSATKSDPVRFTVADGDTYIDLARQAVEQSDSTSLSPVQMIAAQTIIAAEAGMPYVYAGDQVTVSGSVVNAAVETASKLTAEEISRWSVYLPN